MKHFSSYSDQNSIRYFLTLYKEWNTNFSIEIWNFLPVTLSTVDMQGTNGHTVVFKAHQLESQQSFESSELVQMGGEDTELPAPVRIL